MVKRTHRSRKRRKYEKDRWPLVIALLVVIVTAIFFYNLLVQFYSSRPKENIGGRVREALIADSIAPEYPNPRFESYLKDTLEDAGYSVHVVYGAEVNLALYSELTRYSIVILRIHGGKAMYRTPNGELHKINGLFTGLLWSEDYEPLKDSWIATRAKPYNSNKTFLAVLPRFFDLELKGKFKAGSVVIVASCYSLYTKDIAYALGRKGLTYFIGWEGPVTLNYMDKATELLIKYAVKENMGWVDAVKKVNEELGPDPTYGEYLKIIVLT